MRRAVLVVLLCVGGIAASGFSSVDRASCSAAEKAQRTQVAAAFAKQMPAARTAFFKTHKRAADRQSFVKSQQAKLAALRKAAACVVPPPATTPAAPTTPATPPPPPPVATQQTFVFDTGISTADQSEIRDDVDFALRDEAQLLGTAISSVSIFVSTSPSWLADQECRFFGFDNDGCRQSVQAHFASGNATADAGTGGLLLNWASPSWQAGAGETQKIIAHELFHVFQNQLDKLGARNQVTPSNHVRASGPVWLDEGAAEMIGYHVASDRGLLSYPTMLAKQIASAKQVGQPLSAVQTYDQFNAIPNPYSFGHVAADHLVGVAPGGLPALTAYYNALGNGTDWPAAFQSAFGLSVDAYDANFAAYLSKS
ncbi:MAG TPA: hypothetical protein VMU39_30990 [Solirubrobacteraceae bacterium]|nr:hypothetical protein [Solirubrobacteraceae bacterium]